MLDPKLLRESPDPVRAAIAKKHLAVDLDGTDIRIHLVNPGIIDTELFHLPDNEPSLSDLEALPVEALTDAVLKQLDDDVFEIYVPEGFVARPREFDALLALVLRSDQTQPTTITTGLHARIRRLWEDDVGHCRVPRRARARDVRGWDPVDVTRTNAVSAR